MRIVVIDASGMISLKIKEWLRDSPELDIIGFQHTSIETSKQFIAKAKPKVVFIDCAEVKSDAFDIFTTNYQGDFKAVIIATNDSYITKALENDVADYLIKPVQKYSIVRTINHIRREQLLKEAKSSYKTNRKIKKKIDKIGIPTSSGTQYIALENIIFLQANNNYTHIFNEQGKKILVSKSLKSFERKLENTSFLRVHQSFIINLNKVKEICKMDGGFLILSDSSKIPISRSKKKIVKEKLSSFFQTI